MDNKYLTCEEGNIGSIRALRMLKCEINMVENHVMCVHGVGRA